MTKMNKWKLSCALFALCAVPSTLMSAQTFSTLVVFDQTNGGSPAGSLIQGPDGNFYGTTVYGGNNNCGSPSGCGTVFKITPGGTLTTLYEFCSQAQCSDGRTPVAGLVLTANGDFYGTTAAGGAFDGGTVFKITPAGALTTLYSFCSQTNCADGWDPGAIMQAVDGNFYGTTSQYGGYIYGTVFKINPAGHLTTLHSFDGRDGGYPKGGLTQAINGQLYGTTSAGGTRASAGTIYRTDSGGSFTTLYRFCKLGCDEGSAPAATLVETSDGALYGTTAGGGDGYNGGDGTVFATTLAGQLTSLYSFCQQLGCPDGAVPEGLIQATDGNFYSMALYGGSSTNCPGGCGTIFTITPNGTLNVLHNFDGTDDGNETFSWGALLQATNGKFYGMTNAGGNTLECSGYYIGCGTVFSLDMGLGPFVTFVRAAGKVGQTGGILGQGFTGTSAISLNGVPMDFKVISDTFIKATVPAGATTGYVTVTTPSGILTSNVPFHVIP